MEQQLFGTEPFDHISYSQISTYIRCPYLWGQKKYWKKEQPVNDALLLGKAIHAALYTHCRLFLEQGVSDLILGAELAWQEVNKSCDVLERPLPPEVYEQGLQMLKDTIGYGDLRYQYTSLVEQEFRVQLAQAVVVGRIDRIDELAPGVFNLVDYKSSWLWPREEDVEKDLELAIYAAAWREICDNPDIVIFVTLHNVRRSIVVRVEKTHEQMDDTVEYLQVMWERMKSDQECTPAPGKEACLKYGGCWAASWCPAHRYMEIPCDDGNKELPSISDERLYKLYITMERWLPVIRSQLRARIGETGEIKLLDEKQIALAPGKRRVFNAEYEDILWTRFGEFILPGEIGKIDPKKLENRFLDIAGRIKGSDLPMMEQQELLETLDDMQKNLYVEKASTPKIVLEERG